MKAKIWRFLYDAGAIPMAAALLLVFGIGWAWWILTDWIPHALHRGGRSITMVLVKEILFVILLATIFNFVPAIVRDAIFAIILIGIVISFAELFGFCEEIKKKRPF